MKYRVAAITKSGVHDELRRSEMAFGMLGTTNDSNYNHLVRDISASQDVQRNCNVIVTTLDLSSPPETLPIYTVNFIFPPTITISVFPRLYVPPIISL